MQPSACGCLYLLCAVHPLHIVDPSCIVGQSSMAMSILSTRATVGGGLQLEAHPRQRRQAFITLIRLQAIAAHKSSKQLHSWLDRASLLLPLMLESQAMPCRACGQSLTTARAATSHGAWIGGWIRCCCVLHSLRYVSRRLTDDPWTGRSPAALVLTLLLRVLQSRYSYIAGCSETGSGCMPDLQQHICHIMPESAELHALISADAVQETSWGWPSSQQLDLLQHSMLDR